MRDNELIITPKHWGPSTWIFLHLLTFSYPTQPTNEDRQTHRQFLYSFAEILPCQVCRDHFKSRIRKCIEEGALNSRETYVRCMWKIHHDVDPKKSLSFEEFIRLYSKIMQREHLNPIREMSNAECWRTTAILLGIALAGTIGYMIYKKK